MAPADAAAAAEMSARAFTDGEPTTRATGVCESLRLKDSLAFCALYVPRLCREGLCVLAEALEEVEETDEQTGELTSSLHPTGELLGSFLNEDYANPDPEGFEAFLESAYMD